MKVDKYYDSYAIFIYKQYDIFAIYRQGSMVVDKYYDSRKVL